MPLFFCFFVYTHGCFAIDVNFKYKLALLIPFGGEVNYILL